MDYQNFVGSLGCNLLDKWFVALWYKTIHYFLYSLWEHILWGKSTKIDATQTMMIPQYLYYNKRGYCWYCTHLVELNMMRSSGSPDNSPSMMVREWQVAIQVMKGPTSSMEGSSTTPQNLQETRNMIRGISLRSPSATTYGLVLQNYGTRDSQKPADFMFKVLDVLHFCFEYIYHNMMHC